MTADSLIIDVSGLTDDELRSLARVSARMAAKASQPWQRRFHGEQAAAVDRLLTARFLAWHSYVSATGFPDWQTCVDTLPEVPTP